MTEIPMPPRPLKPGELVDPTPGARALELLFQTEFAGHPAYIYMVFVTDEAQLPKLYLRMLAGFAQIWQRHHDEHGGPLPPIMPAVFCAVPGGEALPKTFQEALSVHPKAIPGLAELLPDFRLRFSNLLGASNEELETWAPPGVARAILYAIRDVHDPDRLVANLDRWTASLEIAFAKPEGPKMVPELLRFLFEACPGLDPWRLHAKLRARSPRLEGAFMYTYQQMQREARFGAAAAQA